jgi:hypothetical protein
MSHRGVNGSLVVGGEMTLRRFSKKEKKKEIGIGRGRESGGHFWST